MNLIAYDNIKEKIDKNKTWIDIKKKQLLSREFKYHKYVSILKRYNNKTKAYEYYVALLDNPPFDKKFKCFTLDSYGRSKINVANIWKETYLSQLETNVNISVTLIEHDKDGDIYYLDI